MEKINSNKCESLLVFYCEFLFEKSESQTKQKKSSKCSGKLMVVLSLLYKHQVILVQFQICFKYFKFDPKSMLRIY